MTQLRSFIILAIVTAITTVAYVEWYLATHPIEERNTEGSSSIEQKSDTPPIQNDTLSLKDLADGCPVRDCIPSIDNPEFESAQEADEWLNDDDLIFGLNIDGVTRAYPQRILNWHEIVNDNINGRPIAVTFCPLCGSAVSFDRTVNGVATEFGVSGKLFNSNLVMYDRNEDSFWQQETGEAIIGPAAQRGDVLDAVPMSSNFWSDWLESHPNTEVLSRQTGFSRNYDRYPYGTYEEDGELLFGIENTDQRLPLKEPGYGFEVAGLHKFYPTEAIQDKGNFNDLVNGNQVEIIQANDGTITMLFGGQEIVPIRTFWFAFAAFHPNTDIFIEN